MSLIKMSAMGAASAALIVIILISLNNSNVQTEPLARVMTDVEFIPAPFLSSHGNHVQVPPAPFAANHGVQLKTKSGQLIVTAALKDLFDFYLSSARTPSYAKTQQLIIADLNQQLSKQSLQQALTILTNYFDYKESLITFDQQYPANPILKTQINLSVLARRHEALIALQDRLMTPHVASIFFAAQRQLDSHTLAKADILTSDLSADGKQQALINLNAQLPFNAFQHQQRNQKQALLRQLDQQSDLSPTEKYQQQAAIVGEDTASRLAELDSKRALWQQRLDAFLLEQKNLQNSGLANADYQDAYQKLLERHFQPQERVRAKAMTRVK